MAAVIEISGRDVATFEGARERFVGHGLHTARVARQRLSSRADA